MKRVVIVVDAVKSPPREKLRQLREGRDDDRQKAPPFPTALGETIPHFDVWLLDDPEAVKEALRLLKDFHIPNAVKEACPRDALSALIADSEVEFADVSDALGEIARCLHCERCVPKKRTGFAAFEDDVRSEVGPAARG